MILKCNVKAVHLNSGHQQNQGKNNNRKQQGFHDSSSPSSRHETLTGLAKNENLSKKKHFFAEAQCALNRGSAAPAICSAANRRARCCNNSQSPLRIKLLPENEKGPDNSDILPVAEDRRYPADRPRRLPTPPPPHPTPSGGDGPFTLQLPPLGIACLTHLILNIWTPDVLE